MLVSVRSRLALWSARPLVSHSWALAPASISSSSALPSTTQHGFHTSSVSKALASPSSMLLQKGGGKKGGGGGPAAAAVEEVFDLTKVIPVNIMKDGQDPEYKPDNEYPPWLFKLLEEKPVAEEIMMKGLENMNRSDMRQVLRSVSKKRIKAKNATSAKGGED